MRPTSLDEVVGQSRITKPGSPLNRLILSDPAAPLSSIILWGPPGSGKTTLARLISQTREANFVELSAISATVANVREVIESAKKLLEVYDRPTILFLDEIHRFSKSQQDSLLSAVESGLVTLIAATTENPSFSIIKPLVSRCLVLRLDPLTETEIRTLLERAIARPDWNGKAVEAQAIEFLAKVASGDARRALTLLEAAAAASEDVITQEVAKSASEIAIAYDATGDAHYDTISAFIKSVRGSDVDSAIHYLARMIAGGEDPRFIARRLMILAAEDIGLADPNALVIASAGADVVERIGMPEGRIPLAEVTIYLATAPKSNRAYLAINKALADLEEGAVPPVPSPLRSTGAVGYRYPHDDPRGIIAQKYSEVSKPLYQPSHHGFEKTLAERLKAIGEILEG